MAIWLTILLVLIPIFAFLVKVFIEENKVIGAAVFFILTIISYWYVVYTILDLIVKASR